MGAPRLTGHRPPAPRGVGTLCVEPLALHVLELPDDGRPVGEEDEPMLARIRPRRPEGYPTPQESMALDLGRGPPPHGPASLG